MSDDEYDFDPWETSTGLPDEITVRVTNPHFGFDAMLQDGKACAFFLEGIVIAGGDPDSPEFSQWYTVGKGWEAAKKGTRLIPENSKTRKLNNQTNYSHLFTTLRKAAEKQGLWDEMRKRGNPFEAELWDGLELYLEREDVVRTIQGERNESTRLNVAEIVSIPGSTKSAKAAKATDAAKAETVSVAPDQGDELSPKLKVELRRMAEKMKADGATQSQFAEAAFSDIKGVLDNKAAEDAVMDESEGSIWASA